VGKNWVTIGRMHAHRIELVGEDDPPY